MKWFKRYIREQARKFFEKQIRVFYSSEHIFFHELEFTDEKRIKRKLAEKIIERLYEEELIQIDRNIVSGKTGLEFIASIRVI